MDNNDAKKSKTEIEADKSRGSSLLMKNGKLKSTLMLNSFSLSFLFLAIYAFAYLLLIDPIDAVVAKHMSPEIVSLIESIVPAIIGSVLCCSLHFIIKDKLVVPFAYIWLLIYSVILLIGILRELHGEEISMFLGLYAKVILSPLITGGMLCSFLYFRHKAKHPPLEELPIWKRK